jgi:hypothetical protein
MAGGKPSREKEAGAPLIKKSLVTVMGCNGAGLLAICLPVHGKVL